VIPVHVLVKAFITGDDVIPFSRVKLSVAFLENAIYSVLFWLMTIPMFVI